MKFKHKDSVTLRTLVNSVQILANEAKLKADMSGIEIRAVNASRRAMVDTFWAKTAFEEYSLHNKNKEYEVRLNLTELIKLLKHGGKNESAEVELNEKTGMAHVKIAGRYVKKWLLPKNSFTLPLLEFSNEQMVRPKSTFDVKAKIISSELLRAIEDVQLESAQVRLIAAEGKLILHSQTGSVKSDVELTKGCDDMLESDSLLDLEVKQRSQATFNINDLQEMARQMAEITCFATLEFSSNKPAKLSCIESGITLMYFIAPTGYKAFT